jgi:hydroxymethylpyrimidine pyrophosphatase-like HAD family hydrolase
VHDIPHFSDVPGITERLAAAEVLYTDLDGTLLGRGASLVCDGDGSPSLDAATAVVAANRAGLRIVITSGRNAKQLTEVSRLLAWRDFIAELGCLRSYDRGSRRIWETGDWPAGALQGDETPYEAIERIGAVAMLMRLFPGRIEYHDPWHLDRQVTHILRGNVPVAEAQAALDTLALPVTIVDNGIIHPHIHTLHGVDEIHAIHLVPTGASKQRAIAADLADLGIGRDQAIAIGDSAADVGMADAVGLFVTVANGLDDDALTGVARSRDNIAATRGTRGAGWRELVDAWIAARG